MEQIKKKLKKAPPTQYYKDLVAEYKLLLPDNWKAILYHHHPEYNSEEGYHLVKNVLSLHSSDVTLTEILKKIALRQLTLLKK